MPGIIEVLPDWKPPEEVSLSGTEMNARLSQIPAHTLMTHRLNTWEHRGDEPWWEKVEQYAKREFTHPFLTMVGPFGTGKTHLAFAIGWDWLKDGAGVLYYQVEHLLDALRRGYSDWKKGTDDYNSILQFCYNCNLLILDDFGAHKETDWATAKLDQIVDYRYTYRKPLIVTTNLALNRLPERIADRLSEGLLIQFSGESYRKKKRVKEGKR